ncbi:MAG: dienelactone hydrolase family protein [Chloroflexi bacterium]|nr:dienelactone hydrolase family protein [Chloroflexota bacterium]
MEEHRLASGMTCLTATPTAAGPRPAVVLIHERYGIVEHQRRLAERFAADGYVACLPDLFHRFDGDRDALARGDARADLHDDNALADLDETLAFLREQTYVSGDDIGIVGVCQSGRQPLLYAAHRTDVAAIVVAYGGVGRNDWQPNEGRPSSVADFIADVSCPVLGLFGEQDHVVAVEEATRFRNELEEHRKSYRMRIYEGAPHGWLNDTMPGRYRHEQSEAAWAEIIRFFGETLDNRWDPNHVTWSFESSISPAYDFANNRRLE